MTARHAGAKLSLLQGHVSSVFVLFLRLDHDSTLEPQSLRRVLQLWPKESEDRNRNPICPFPPDSATTSALPDRLWKHSEAFLLWCEAGPLIRNGSELSPRLCKHISHIIDCLCLLSDISQSYRFAYTTQVSHGQSLQHRARCRAFE